MSMTLQPPPYQEFVRHESGQKSVVLVPVWLSEFRTSPERWATEVNTYVRAQLNGKNFLPDPIRTEEERERLSNASPTLFSDLYGTLFLRSEERTKLSYRPCKVDDLHRQYFLNTSAYLLGDRTAQLLLRVRGVIPDDRNHHIRKYSIFFKKAMAGITPFLPSEQERFERNAASCTKSEEYLLDPEMTRSPFDGMKLYLLEELLQVAPLSQKRIREIEASRRPAVFSDF